MSNPNSIEDITLVIGVWTNKTDAYDTEVFSLNIHLPNIIDDIDIIEDNSMGKVLCNPSNSNKNIYNCLLMITYTKEETNLGLPLLIHAESSNKNATTNIFGNFISWVDFEEKNLEYLKQLI